MNKTTDFDVTFDKNRRVVLYTIRQHLYPEEEFPPKLFPDLPSVLLNCFMEVIKSRAELMEVYQTSRDKSKIESLTREILVFKNLLENQPTTVVLMYRTSVKKYIRYKHSNSASD